MGTGIVVKGKTNRNIDILSLGYSYSYTKSVLIMNYDSFIESKREMPGNGNLEPTVLGSKTRMHIIIDTESLLIQDAITNLLILCHFTENETITSLRRTTMSCNIGQYAETLGPLRRTTATIRT